LHCGVCTGVRLLSPGENPIAVGNNNNNNNNTVTAGMQKFYKDITSFPKFYAPGG
jgi:hypothetical protein